MTTATSPARFPLLPCVAALTCAAVVVWLGARPVVGFLAQPDARLSDTVLIMTLIAWLTSIVGLLPVLLLGPLGVLPTVWGYFAGAGLRVVLCLISWYYAVSVFGLPSDSTGLALVAAYVPLLFVEVGFVAHYLWQKDLAAAKSTASAGSTPAHSQEVFAS